MNLNIKRVNLLEVSSDILDIQFISATATVSVVHTDLGETDLKELGDVDQESSEDGWEEITEDSAGPGLDLPVVVRPTDCQEPLNTHRHNYVDTAAHTDPRNGNKIYNQM